MNAQTEKPQLLQGVTEEVAREVQAIEIRKESLPLGAQLKDREKQFFAALPAHMPAERFIRVIMTAVNNSPALWHANRQSFWNACMRAAQDGLLPDGRDGALVIFNAKDGKDEKGKDVWIAKVQWMPMIGGIRKKVRNSGEIKDWNAQVVHAKDVFEFELGDAPYIKHRPFMDGDPGPVIAAYSIAQFKSGELSREVMTRAQIEKVRSVSRSKDKGPWVDWYDEMCRKTVARRHSKSLPMSSDLDDLIRRDDELYDLEGKSDKQIAAPRRSLTERLDLLAEGEGNAPIDDALQEIDASETIENNTPPSPSHRAEAAAADRASSVENGAGSPTNDPEGGPAPDPRAGAGRPTAEGAASAIPAGAASANSAKPLSAEDKAVVAALMADGESQARLGSTALREWLDRLPSGQRKMLPDVLVEEWIGIARARSKAPPAPVAEKSFPDDEARRARKADIEREGEAHAQAGEAALRNFLDGMAERGEGKLVTPTMITHWRGIAKTVRR